MTENFPKLDPSKREWKFRPRQPIAIVLATGWVVFSSLLPWNLSMISQFQDIQSEQLHHVQSSLFAEKSMRALLPASVWATRKLPHFNESSAKRMSSLLTVDETQKAMSLCGKFLYSTLGRAIHVRNMGYDTFVATGDIDSMWTRDSVVQMTIYLRLIASLPWVRLIIDGAIRRNAFNILQDPYANAYEHEWRDPEKLQIQDRVIGRGGFVATRNYELDSGAYFIMHLYDYYVANGIYNPEAILREPVIFEAVMALIKTWIVEQRHDELSPYRYFELQSGGKGAPSGYTGMTWSGFRPSDDPCQYGYLIPANIHAAGALQRLLILNDRIWQNSDLERKASKLLREIEQGINTYGIVTLDSGERVYAYEVDGLGKSILGFDDANVPSLLSIPLLGWSGYDREVYRNTRKQLLSEDSNLEFFQGRAFRGIGSQHTPEDYIWPMAMVVQGLTDDGPDREEQMAFQMRQLLRSATGDSMHESVYKDNAAFRTREWFEWVSTGIG